MIPFHPLHVSGMEKLLELVRVLIEIQRYSYADVSIELQNYIGESSGLSNRSIRRFCARHDINMISQLDDSALDRLVRGNVTRVSLFII